MDGNSAKKAPVLDHLVDTSSTSAKPASDTESNKPVLASMNGAYTPSSSSKLNRPATQQPSNKKPEIHPQNRRTDKSEFELELTKTVNRIMLKHFESASEEIVQQVLSEVRARLPGRKKN